jgi:MoxR-like ATPase
MPVTQLDGTQSDGTQPEPLPHGRPVATPIDPIDPTAFATLFSEIVDNVERVLRGKRRAVHLAVVALFADGHLLVEDVPGVGKTSLAKAIANSIDGAYRRIQFTPDLLPSDVTGVSIWDRQRSDFEFRPGGVFANIVLADEINRASPKTQSALLEAMEERQVTVDSSTHRLGAPFMVIATQNPIELEGTYPLPEAQLDRFVMRIRLGYPDRSAELAILESRTTPDGGAEALDPVADAATIARWQQRIAAVHVETSIARYIVDLVDATRHHRDLMLGVSPRGALALQRCARTLAASLGRAYVVPDDVKALAPAILEHRIVLAPEAQMRGTTASAVVQGVLDSVAIPTTRPAGPDRGTDVRSSAP